jgi:hypothetical protein
MRPTVQEREALIRPGAWLDPQVEVWLGRQVDLGLHLQVELGLNHQIGAKLAHRKEEERKPIFVTYWCRRI